MVLIEEFLTARATRKPSPHTLAGVPAGPARGGRAGRRGGHPSPPPGRAVDHRPLPPGPAGGLRPVRRSPGPRVGAPGLVHLEQLLHVPGGRRGRRRAIRCPRWPAPGAAPPAQAAAGRGHPGAAARRPRRATTGRQRDPWPERDLAVLALALCAGLRLSELLALRVGSLAGRPGERRVEVAGKGGRPRAVPIEPELDRVLVDYLDSRARRFGSRRCARTRRCWWIGAVSRCGGVGCSIWWSRVTGGRGSPTGCRGVRGCTRCGTRSRRGWPRTGRARRRSCGCWGMRRWRRRRRTSR